MSQYTNAKPGFGAILNRANDAGTAWVKFAEVTAISWSGPSREIIETFILDAPSNYVDKLQGTLNPGSLTCNVNYTRLEFTDIKLQLETRGVRQYQLKLPDGEALEFDGFIAEMSLDVGSDDVMQGELTVEVSGQPVFVAVASATP